MIQIGIESKEGQKIPASYDALIFYKVLVLADLFNRHEKQFYAYSKIDDAREKYIKWNMASGMTIDTLARYYDLKEIK